MMQHCVANLPACLGRRGYGRAELDGIAAFARACVGELVVEEGIQERVVCGKQMQVIAAAGSGDTGIEGENGGVTRGGFSAHGLCVVCGFGDPFHPYHLIFFPKTQFFIKPLPENSGVQALCRYSQTI